MAEYQVLSWRGIPAQIRVFDDGRPISHLLPERFQMAIDQVAMEEDLVNTDAYLEQWAWSEKKSREGNAQEVAEAVIDELTRT